MIETVRFEAEVLTFAPSAFVDRYSHSCSAYDQATLRVTDPGGNQHRDVTVVIDETSERLAALRHPGTHVWLTLDREALDLDVLFSGAVVDLTIVSAAQENQERPT